MGLLATLTIGTILLVLVLIILQFFFVILSLFICGKIVGSINDEFSSAMKTFGWWFLVSIGFVFLSFLVGSFLDSYAMVMTISMAVLYIAVIVVNFIIVKKIYDLEIGKTFLFFILFIVINTILTAVNFFLSTLILGFSIFGMIGASTALISPTVVDEPIVIEEADPAQRARDAAQTADINNLSQALEIYYEDNEKYPGLMGDITCLTEDNEVSKELSSYLAGDKIPKPIASDLEIKLFGFRCTGSYMYRRSTDGFILATKSETRSMGNFDARSLPYISMVKTGKEISDYILDDANSVKSENLYYLKFTPEPGTATEEEPKEEKRKPKFPTLPVVEEPSEGPVDCGDDQECFENQFLTCADAIYKVEQYGVEFTIAKSDTDICVLDMVMSMSGSPETSKCEFPISDITSKGLTMDSINDDENVKEYCSGAILDELEDDEEIVNPQEGAFIDQSTQNPYDAPKTDAQINDSERKKELGTILTAIYQSQTSPSQRGALPQCLVNEVPTSIPECDTDSSGSGVGNGGYEGAIEFGTSGYDCSTTLVPGYLSEMPIDPLDTYDATATGYHVCQDTTGAVSRIYIIAVGAEHYTDDGGCEIPGAIDEAMCISG